MHKGDDGDVEGLWLVVVGGIRDILENRLYNLWGSNRLHPRLCWRLLYGPHIRIVLGVWADWDLSDLLRVGRHVYQCLISLTLQSIITLPSKYRTDHAFTWLDFEIGRA